MLGTNDNLCRLVAVLDGRVHLNTLRHLNLALGEPRRNDEPDDTLAIGLDANILLNLGKAESSADVVDYLAEQHSGPLILPHQALIEFWNNEVPAISGPSDRLRANFKALSNELKNLIPSTTTSACRQHVSWTNFLKHMLVSWKGLLQKACVRFLSRWRTRR